MSDPAGKAQAVKARLNDYVAAALGGSVSNNWRINIMLLNTMPVSTIRFERIRLENTNYGRKTPDDGVWATYPFTIHIHEEIDTSVEDGNPISHPTMDLAEELIDYFVSIRGDSTERTTYKIQWMDGFRIQEISPRSIPRNIYTIAVTGNIYTQWVDA